MLISSVIRLTGPGLPYRFLTRQYDCEAIKVGDNASIHRLIEGEQPRLMRQKLAHRYFFFALLSELRPVLADQLLVVEPASRVRYGERHRCQALCGRVDDHHGVLLPGFAASLVPNAAPQVDDLFTTVIGAAGSAQLVPPNKILGERLAHSLKAGADVPVNTEAV
jgi:hypothetical protein